MQSEVSERGNEAKGEAQRETLAHFVWRRRSAKILWALTGIFWFGAALSLSFGPLSTLYDNAGPLYAIFLPPLVFLYLLIGWLRQEIDAGRIVLQPVPPTRDRSVGGWSDPMADRLDPRSPFHWQDSQ